MVSWRQALAGGSRSGLRGDAIGGFGSCMKILFDAVKLGDYVEISI
jgi:hypothetical protein